ncbi:MAG: SRPBCC family protein [Ilumatobacteraceae bacterium]
MSTPSQVTTDVGPDTVSATAVVDAPPTEVFEFLRRPANHAEISGDGTVRDTNSGEERLALGGRFGMKMKVGVPYRVSSTVVELEEDRLIAWAHFGGHRWRWTLEPVGDGQTRVTETFDQSTSRFPPGLRLLGYPARHRDNVEQSVRNVAAHFTAG